MSFATSTIRYNFLLYHDFAKYVSPFFKFWVVELNRRRHRRYLLPDSPRLLQKEGDILSLILFRCAKRSILPDRTTLLENELARLQSEFHSAKSQNSSLEYPLLFQFFLRNPAHKLLQRLSIPKPAN